MYLQLKNKNPNLKLFHVQDPLFSSFGKVLNFSYFEEAKSYLEQQTSIPSKDNVYVAHDDSFLQTLTDLSIYKDLFGDIALEYGYVNGQNQKLNALEFHKSSEINIAVTPLILLLGHTNDIINGQYNSNNVIAFYVPEKTAIEIYPKTLHFSPCKVLDSGFKCGVILPYETNMNFVKPNHLDDESRYLFKTNKWLLAHPEHQKMISLGAYIGITGINIEIKY